MLKALLVILSAVTIIFCSVASAVAQERRPAVGLESILDTDVYDNGLMAFNNTNLMFAPKAPVNAKVSIKKADGKKIADYGFFRDYKYSEGVFGMLKPENHSEHTFSPGSYVLEYSVSGALATSVPFSVAKKSTSDDPFAPGSTVKFEGPWQQFAYFTFRPNRDIESVSVAFWAGASDLAPGNIRGPIHVKLMRDGKLVAHSKVTVGMLDHEWLRRHTELLFHPHDAKGAPNARLFTKSDLEKAGDYRLTVELRESAKKIREYEFKSAGGKLAPHPRTVLGYEPHAQYIPPRVIRKGSSTYAFEEAFWIESPSN